MNVLELLQARFRDTLSGLVADPAPFAAMVKPAQDARQGDYQANCAMPLGKQLGQKPQDIAREIVKRLGSDDMLEDVQVAGPGFINLRLRTSWLTAQLERIATDADLGVEPTTKPRTYVVDFSSPNVAKPMHVGHLRSTIIGDCLARLLRRLGHRVITDNHLGDWGEQFGILLYGYKHFCDTNALQTDPVRELARLYVHVRGLMKAGEEEDNAGLDNPVAEAARQETARLHAGDAENQELWQRFMPWCLEEIDRIYRRLDVRFDHTLGESFYNPMLTGVVEDLLENGIARVCEDGAVAVFITEDGPPSRVRKKDGAFTYTTTDLATIEYRIEHWHPDAMLYVVGAPQALHFQNLFEAARRWGYDHVVLEHIAFGAVLGNDRKPIKTRAGGSVELSQLLDEAVDRARAVYQSSRTERQERGEEIPDLSPEEQTHIAEVVGLGAVKYADLSQNRTSDYVFSWEKMLAMDGNTATYMQYAYARTRSILRKSAEDAARFRTSSVPVSLAHPNERALALALMRLPEALANAAQEYKPNLLTNYLWDLAKAFSGFFQNCNVLKAETPALRESRLLLCDLTGRTIQQALDLLGIKTVEQM